MNHRPDQVPDATAATRAATFDAVTLDAVTLDAVTLDAVTLDAAEIGRIFREESGRSVAALIRVFGDIDLAEDAVQEAFVAALRTWPAAGLPPNPGGWITTTARNRALDRLRRESRGRELLGDLAMLARGLDDPGMPEEAAPVRDDRLCLICTCCHPALSTEAQVALTLRLLGGLSTKEVARAFLVAEPTMAPSGTSFGGAAEHHAEPTGIEQVAGIRQSVHVPGLGWSAVCLARARGGIQTHAVDPEALRGGLG
jgi:RNA polymerase sigma factor (sigma-70 family)